MLSIKGGQNNQSTFNQVDNLEELTRRGIRQGFFRLGNELKKELNREVLAKNKRGKTYIRRDRIGRRRRHVASAAHQTPANRTGAYRRAIGYQLRGSEQLEFGIRDTVDYGLYLEIGTKHMRARPGVGNAVKVKQRGAMTFFEGSLEAALNETFPPFPV